MNKTPDRKKPKRQTRLLVKSPFRDWVDEQGQVAAAKLIGVSERAVRAWLNGEYPPTIGFLEKIVKVSQGRLTRKMILEHVNAAIMIRSTSH